MALACGNLLMGVLSGRVWAQPTWPRVAGMF
jgi:hypothetical protein